MEKIHIVITGRRNTGKSSLINSILGQNKAIVTDVAGTTTDPVKKSFEIPGIAPVIFIDTAGIDDEGALGQLRIQKTLEAVRQADAAILVIADNRFGTYEEKLIEIFRQQEQPFLLVFNKSDETKPNVRLQKELSEKYRTEILDYSTRFPERERLIQALSEWIGKPVERSLLEGLVSPGQMVLLVTPIDSEAPTGRLILPQVQILRALLDHRCISIVLQPEEIPAFFAYPGRKPDLIITDSQAFARVAPYVPQDIPLTSFSIVMAHYKGYFEKYLEGTKQIAHLSNGDRILMLESCSHHVSCEDIGRVKIPGLLKKFTGKQLEFDFVAGLDHIERPFKDYALIIQCGGCMVTSRQLRNRLKPALEAQIPVSNYGMVLAYIQGIFERVTEIMKKGNE